MRQLVGEFYPSLEPLRPMGQAHRGVPQLRRPPLAVGEGVQSLKQSPLASPHSQIPS